MAAEIYTSRWANKDLASLACQPVGISRGTPRFPTGYRYRLMRELAPSREAFGLEDPEEFDAAYRAGLEGIGWQTILGKLERISREAEGLPLVLLCFEASPAACHRGLLASCLRSRTGIVVSELRPGDLPGRPDNPQGRLF